MDNILDILAHPNTINTIKEVGSFLLLTFVVGYMGMNLIKEVKRLNDNIVIMNRGLSSLIDRTAAMYDGNRRIELKLDRLFAAITVAFDGSNVASYRQASHILHMELNGNHSSEEDSRI